MTRTNHPSWPIAAPLRQRINRAAHEQGHTHELTLRADWLAKVQTARDAGATFAELNQMIDVMVTPPGACKSDAFMPAKPPITARTENNPYGQ